MKLVITIIARLGLVLTVSPSIAFFFDLISLDAVKTTMIIGTVLWLGSSPFLQKQHENS